MARVSDYPEVLSEMAERARSLASRGECTKARKAASGVLRYARRHKPWRGSVDYAKQAARDVKQYCKRGV